MNDLLETWLPNVSMIWPEVWDATYETLYMVIVGAVIGYAIGLVLGLLLLLTRRGGLTQNVIVYNILDKIVNIVRSIPFIILMALLVGVTRVIVGTSIGTEAMIVPIVGATVPFYARQVENALLEIDPGLVRGLDYYTRTVFEFPSKSLGFALGGGGRYDGLVEEFGGKPTPGLGFGLGLDRILMALEAQQVEFPQLPKCEMYIATMGEEAQKKAFLLLDELHRCGIPADTDLCGRGLKAQMKYAGKIGAKFTMVLGDNEAPRGQG